MRPFFIALLLTFSSYVFAQSNCEQYGDFTSLTKTWLSFRDSSLKKNPEQISQFYKFPLKLLSPFDEDKPIVISKKFFLEEYETIFRDVDEEDTDLFKALKKTRGNEYIPRNEFDANGCAYAVHGEVRIEDYNFVWKKRNGWLIESVFYGKEYFTLKDLIARPVSENSIAR